MQKRNMVSWLVALAVGVIALPAFAQEKAFTENATVLTQTNITLTSTAVTAIGIGKGGNVRSFVVNPSVLARIYVLPSASTTASTAVTNFLTAAKGVSILGGTNQTYTLQNPLKVDFSRSGPMGYWSKYFYVYSPDGTGVFSYVELGR